MKARYLLIGLLLVAGCTKSTAENPEAAAKNYFATMVAPPRKYQPLELTRIATPAHAKPAENEVWFSHHYTLTDSTGRISNRVDTVVVEPNGRVLFY